MYQTTGWLLLFMAAGLLIQGLAIFIAGPELYDTLILKMTLPARFQDLVWQPWSLFTWPFFYSAFSFLTILFGGMMLFTFGRIHQQFLNDTRTRRLVWLAIPLIGLLTVTYSTVRLIGSDRPAAVEITETNNPQEDVVVEDEAAAELSEAKAEDAASETETTSEEAQTYVDNQIQRWSRQGTYVGGIVPLMILLMISSITLVPRYPIRLFLFGQVEIRIVGLIFFALIWISSGLFTPYGFAVLIAGLLGYLNVYLLRQGTDVTEIVWSFYKEDKKPRMKVKYSNPQKWETGGEHQVATKTKVATAEDGNNVPEEIVDRILEKIHATGYDSLSREEKELLFKASNSKNGNKD
ncbi:MAG: DUF6576 domain-containing protein [Bacteroidota bacterium]